MKTLKLKVAMIGFLILLSPTGFAAVMGNEGSGGGAACIGPNGVPSTLYYCGAYGNAPLPVPTAPAPAVPIDGPSENPAELASLESFITNYPYFTADVRAAVLKTIEPTFYRKYFSTLAPPDLTAPIVARIKNEFQLATGINTASLSLYAVTDTAAKISNYDGTIAVTYLLPTYAALPTFEQKMVALFHESLWVLAPSADYSTIVKTEMSFEAVLADPDNTARNLEFLQNMIAIIPGIPPGITSPGLMTLILKNDIESGALDGFVSPDGTVSNFQLFGLANIQCFESSQPNNQVCATGYENYMDGLRRSYPKSLFLATVGDKIKSLLDSEVSDGGGYDIFMQAIAIMDGEESPLLVWSGSADSDSFIWSESDTRFDNDSYFFDVKNDPGSVGVAHLLRSLVDHTASVGDMGNDNGPAYVWPTEDLVTIKINTSVDNMETGGLLTVPAPATPVPSPSPAPPATGSGGSCFLGIFCSK